jgi:hypothetical protein
MIVLLAKLTIVAYWDRLGKGTASTGCGKTPAWEGFGKGTTSQPAEKLEMPDSFERAWLPAVP